MDHRRRSKPYPNIEIFEKFRFICLHYVGTAGLGGDVRQVIEKWIGGSG
jgi:hypothetical protein